MKFNNILKVLVLPAVTLAAGCNSDYLQLAPETSVSTNEITTSTEAAQLAVNGIAEAMNTQYQSTDINQFNGEAYINTMFNDGLGQDYICALLTASFGPDILKDVAFTNDATYLNTMTWRYAYNIINMANGVINGIDDAEGSESDRNYVKAEALTYRAFGYLKVLMYFAPRWEDSENGAAYVAPLRLQQGTEPCPLATMNEILDQIYSDLDTAIECFENSTASRPSKLLPDVSIAQGVYARVALIKHDWTKAQQMAHDARQSYEIMSNDTYLSGFYEDNNDFMWISSNNEEDIYYWSFGCHFGTNGRYTKNWSLGAGAIDYDFYKTLDPKDIRRQCFLTPDKIKVLPSSWNPGKITEAEFWNPFLVDETSQINVAFGPYNKEEAAKLQESDKTGKYDGKWGTYNVALRYGMYYLRQVFKGDKEAIVNEMDDGDYTAYYVSNIKGDVLIGPGTYATMVTTPFGAHYKFWANTPYGNGFYPYMRASEMCIVEAEAAYMAGDMTTAKSCLTEINGKRIPGYTCSTSGQALLDEIRTCRRIELWGEGHNFTDFKRWNLPIKRTAWKANDPTSGNWPNDCAGVTQPDEINKFILMVPRTEYQYNSAIDLKLLPYTEK